MVGSIPMRLRHARNYRLGPPSFARSARRTASLAVDATAPPTRTAQHEQGRLADRDDLDLHPVGTRYGPRLTAAAHGRGARVNSPPRDGAGTAYATVAVVARLAAQPPGMPPPPPDAYDCTVAHTCEPLSV